MLPGATKFREKPRQSLENAQDNHLVDVATFDRLVKELIEIRKMLYGLRKRLLEAVEAAAARRRRRKRR